MSYGGNAQCCRKRNRARVLRRGGIYTLKQEVEKVILELRLVGIEELSHTDRRKSISGKGTPRVEG